MYYASEEPSFCKNSQALFRMPFPSLDCISGDNVAGLSLGI